MNTVHHAIFQRENKQDLHPFTKMMCTVLHNKLKSVQAKHEFDQYIYDSKDINTIPPPSKKSQILEDVTDKIQPGIDHDIELTKRTKFITAVDWRKYEQNKNHLVLPNGDM